ncbi:hypothetical protein GIB67_008722 [Kingdonia uniflora]|uniref:Uncharacterized protein n=1 Tax=Kingdonia uniflora TaxID=39325 RepID=A0A7J7NGZ1_9MAGN|nr:hypothetical protein GIB67_008722 [Kingdonia uniflora]
MIVLEDDVDVNKILKPTKTTKIKFTQDGKPKPQTTKPKAKKLKPSELPEEELNDLLETYTSEQEQEQEQEEHEGLDGFDEGLDGVENVLNKKNMKVWMDLMKVWMALKITNDGHTMVLIKGSFQHVCEGNTEGFNKLANAQWVAAEIEELVRDITTLTPKSVARRTKAATWDQDGLVPRTAVHLEKVMQHYRECDVEGGNLDDWVSIGSSDSQDYHVFMLLVFWCQ